MIFLVKLMAWVTLAMIAYVLWKFATGQPLSPYEQMLLDAIR